MGQRDPHRDNAVRFDRKREAGHVESHFLKANSPDGERAIWLKLTILARAGRASEALTEVWGIAFRRGGEHVAAKSTSALTASRLGEGDGPFRIVFGDPSGAGAEIDGERWRGGAMTASHSLRWELRLEPRSAPARLLSSEVFYRVPFPRQKVMTPYPDAVVHGHVEVDGERWELDGWRGMQGHNWGPRHTGRYVWAHCNVLWQRGDAGRHRLEDTWLEAAAGRLDVGPWTTPWLAVARVVLHGEHFDLAGPRAIANARSAVRDGTDGRAGAGAYSWRLDTHLRDLRLSLALTAPPDGLVGLRYENPSGPLVHCLNSKLSSCSVRLERGDTVLAELESDAAALELATTDPGHGIRLAV